MSDNKVCNHMKDDGFKMTPIKLSNIEVLQGMAEAKIASYNPEKKENDSEW